MSKSWDHAIRLLREDELTERTRPYDCSNGRRCPNRQPWVLPGGGEYTIGGDAAYTAFYRYVTGRMGRVSYRQLYYCPSCAEKYAAKHELQLDLSGGGTHPKRSQPETPAGEGSGQPDTPNSKK